MRTNQKSFVQDKQKKNGTALQKEVRKRKETKAKGVACEWESEVKSIECMTFNDGSDDLSCSDVAMCEYWWQWVCGWMSDG